MRPHWVSPTKPIQKISCKSTTIFLNTNYFYSSFFQYFFNALIFNSKYSCQKKFLELLLLSEASQKAYTYRFSQKNSCSIECATPSILGCKSAMSFALRIGLSDRIAVCQDNFEANSYFFCFQIILKKLGSEREQSCSSLRLHYSSTVALRQPNSFSFC